MKRKIMQQNSQMWRSLWLLLLVFMGGVHTDSAIKKDDVLSGSSVYISESYGTYSLLNNSKLSFKVLTVATDRTHPGTVSVEPSSNVSFEGALTIPSVIYVQQSASSRYTVTTIPDNAFQNKKGITDLYFSKDGYYTDDGPQTIGANAFYGITTLTDTIQLPASVTSIGDNAFALPSGSNGKIENVAMEANNKDAVKVLEFGKTIFANRNITNLYCLGSFPDATYDGDQTFNKNNVTNLFFFGDGTDEHNQGDGVYGYYHLLKTITDAHSNFTPLGQNLYLPSDDVMNFVTQCTKNDHTDWIPETVNSLTFDQTTDKGTYTLMLNSSAGSYGFELALHKAKLNENVKELDLNFDDLSIDIFPTTTNQNGNVTQIDSKAFAGNDNLQSITINPTDSCLIEGNAFQGLKSLQYLNLSNKNIKMANGYSLSRVPTTDLDKSVAYKYTKSTKEYKYELSELTPFGGLPAYTLVFMPKKSDGSYPSYPSETQKKETVYKIDKIDDPTPTKWERPLNENYMLGYNDGDKSHWYCDNFGVYDVPELIPSNASDPSCSWYSWSTPDDFQVKVQSTFYRDFKAGVPSSVCLPFAPDKPSTATFYTYKTSDNTSVTITSVNTPAANTPYFIQPTANTQLTSTTEQTISTGATPSTSNSNMHGVYTGQSMENVSNAYGMAAKQFTYNGTTYPAGTFVKLTQSANTYINPFRAYLTLGSSSAKASVMDLIMDNTPTAIKHTTIQEGNDTPYYNLQGIKTTPSTRGIYIHNGRKVIIR